MPRYSILAVRPPPWLRRRFAAWTKANHVTAQEAACALMLYGSGLSRGATLKLLDRLARSKGKP